MTKDEYCKLPDSGNIPGCKSDEGNVCRKALTPECMACHDGVTVEAYCKQEAHLKICSSGTDHLEPERAKQLRSEIERRAQDLEHYDQLGQLALQQVYGIMNRTDLSNDEKERLVREAQKAALEGGTNFAQVPAHLQKHAHTQTFCRLQSVTPHNKKL